MKNAYLSRYGADGKWTPTPPVPEGICQVVVIPALAESGSLFHTLASLAANPPEERNRTAILVVVNNRGKETVRPEEWEDNQRTLRVLRTLSAGQAPPHGLLDGPSEAAAKGLPGLLNLAVVDAASPGLELPEKTGGVGLARKIGLDRALDILSPRQGEQALLFCLDADTLVERNYLSSVHDFFTKRGPGAGVVRFRHRRTGDEGERRAIVCYEIFLRYYVLGLKHARSPYAFHTIGSTMVCTPETYAAVRGMNRRKGGEDFYFLNKLAKVTAVGDIRTTTVHPAARPSGRVPFGTGRRVVRFLEDGQNEYVLYDPRIFFLLRSWLRAVGENPGENETSLLARAGDIHPGLERFLRERDFPTAWAKIGENAKSGRQRLSQFHGWFDGFETFKLIRFLSREAFPPLPMFQALEALFHRSAAPIPSFDVHTPVPPLDIQEEILAVMERREGEPFSETVEGEPVDPPSAFVL